jgi:uncharacterized protein
MLLVEYVLMLIPGLLLAGALFMLLRKAHPLLHLLIFIIVFIFTRDAMTPLGLWRIGSEGFLWIRFVDQPVTLILLGLSTIGLVFLMQAAAPKLGVLLKWSKGNLILGILAGLAGAVLAALPILLIYRFGVPIGQRGGDVPLMMLPSILFLTLSGNLYEEVLFRGYFFGWLEEKEGMKPILAGLVSGLFFSFGHVFLAYNVTNVGISLLVFTLWEGCLAGWVRAKHGLFPAVLTHGLAVFLLAGGIF